MLRYKTETRPGLVALYDIRPGNGAGPFLQPRSPHGATDCRKPLPMILKTRVRLRTVYGQPVGIWTVYNMQLIRVTADESTEKRHWSIFPQPHHSILHINTYSTIEFSMEVLPRSGLVYWCLTALSA